MTRRLISILALTTVVGVLGAARPALASVVTQMDLETLVRLSSVIVRGEVESVVSRQESGGIYTYVTIRVDEGLKGAADGDRVTLRQLGGSASGYAMVVPGEARFQAAERVVVFAQPTKAGPLMVTGLFQGKYRIADVNGQEVVFQHEAGAGTMVVGERGASSSGQPLADFLNRVRELIARSPAPSSARSSSSTSADIVERGSPYTLLGCNPFAPPGCAPAATGRWFEFDSGGTVVYRFSPTAAPSVVPGGARPHFVIALAAWTNVPGTSIKLADGGNTSPACFGTVDFNNSVVHGDPCGEMPTFDSGSCSGVLALGGSVWQTSPTKAVNGVTFGQNVQGRVVFNTGADCLWSGAGNYEEVVGHEVGHSIGLGHSCGDSMSPPCAGNPVLDDALMRATAHGDGRGASVRADDIAGVDFIYEFVQGALNQAAFMTGQTMHLTVSGNLAAASDFYLAIILPDGSFLTFGPGLSPSPRNTLIPLATGIPALGSFTGVPLASFTFPPGTPPGTYVWVTAFAPTGVSPLAANLGVHFASFTFSP